MTIESVKENELYCKGISNKAVLIIHGFAININQTDILFEFFKSKGFTVARPILPGHDGSLESLKRFGPDDWLSEAKRWLNKLSEAENEIYIVGISFGSNLGVSLCMDSNPKIKALIVSEMPVFFSLRMAFISHFIQPLYELMGIEFIKKEGLLYRKNSLKREGAFAFVPVKIAGEIRKYVKNRTRKEIEKIKIPIFVMYAAKSDMVNNHRTVDYISKKVKNIHKSYRVPINNHDLNILDKGNKVIMLEKIYHFIKNI